MKSKLLRPGLACLALALLSTGPLPAQEAPRKLQQLQFGFDEFQPKVAGRDPLAGREWTPVTELEPLLDPEQKKELQALLEKVRKDSGLRFIVITAKGEDIRFYPPIAMALLRDRLALNEGGVLVVTDTRGTQLTAYTSLLETRLGGDELGFIDKDAFAAANVAEGNGERALVLVKTILEGVQRRIGDWTPASPVAAPAAPPAPVAEPAPRQYKIPLWFLALTGLLFVALVGLAAWAIGRKAGTSTRRPEPAPPREPEIAVPAPAPAPVVENVPPPPAEPAPAAPRRDPYALRPRKIESRISKPSAPISERSRELAAELAALADSTRRKSATDYFDAATELDPMTLQEIQSHYRALLKVVPPASRPALADSLDVIVAHLDPDKERGRPGPASA
jgi:hypothetical protein